MFILSRELKAQATTISLPVANKKLKINNLLRQIISSLLNGVVSFTISNNSQTGSLIRVDQNVV